VTTVLLPYEPLGPSPDAGVVAPFLPWRRFQRETAPQTPASGGSPEGGASGHRKRSSPARLSDDTICPQAPQALFEEQLAALAFAHHAGKIAAGGALEVPLILRRNDRQSESRGVAAHRPARLRPKRRRYAQLVPQWAASRIDDIPPHRPRRRDVLAQPRRKL